MPAFALAMATAVAELNRMEEINGVAAANAAVIEAAKKGSAIIFLTRSQYQDLCYRAGLSELARYKGRAIYIVSDPVE